jgi:hypothetical protein
VVHVACQGREVLQVTLDKSRNKSTGLGWSGCHLKGDRDNVLLLAKKIGMDKIYPKSYCYYYWIVLVLPRRYPLS